MHQAWRGSARLLTLIANSNDFGVHAGGITNASISMQIWQREFTLGVAQSLR